VEPKIAAARKALAADSHQHTVRRTSTVDVAAKRPSEPTALLVIAFPTLESLSGLVSFKAS
jgi:hypothetical protein